MTEQNQFIWDVRRSLYFLHWIPYRIDRPLQLWFFFLKNDQNDDDNDDYYFEYFFYYWHC